MKTIKDFVIGAFACLALLALCGGKAEGWSEFSFWAVKVVGLGVLCLCAWLYTKEDNNNTK